MKTKSALSWFGSDSEVASKLASMFDHCNHVAIPFIGGASILPHLKARAILANDLHDAAINFYRVASGSYGAALQAWLFKRCQNTLSHPDELRLAQDYEGSECDLRAWAFWAQCWLGRKGKGGCAGAVKLPSVRYTASGGTNASRIKAAAGDLEAWAKHFERCEWTCEDFRTFIPKLKDGPKNGIYIDAPWVGLGEGYLHSFSGEDHHDLSKMLERFKSSTVVVRYGDTPLVRELYKDWEIIDAESRTQTNAVKGEVWCYPKRKSNRSSTHCLTS